MNVSCELCVESDGVVLTDGLLIDELRILEILVFNGNVVVLPTFRVCLLYTPSSPSNLIYNCRH